MRINDPFYYKAVLKTFAVVFLSESGDFYYETFQATKSPSSKQILKAFTPKFGKEIEYMFVQNVWEVEPDLIIKVKK